MQISQVRSFILPMLSNNTQPKSSNPQNNRQLQNDTFVRSNMAISSPINFSGNYWKVAHVIKYGQTMEIDKDIDPNMIGYVYNLLMSAAVYGNDEMAEKLLARKDIDVNAKIGNGNTALLLAIKYKEPTIAEKILAHKDIDVNAKNDSGYTALNYAIMNDLTGVTEKLLARKDVDVNTTDNSGHTALITAVLYKRADVVEKLLRRKDIDVNAENDSGKTALMLATEKGYNDIAESIEKYLETNEVQ